MLRLARGRWGGQLAGQRLAWNSEADPLGTAGNNNKKRAMPKAQLEKQSTKQRFEFRSKQFHRHLLFARWRSRYTRWTCTGLGTWSCTCTCTCTWIEWSVVEWSEVCKQCLPGYPGAAQQRFCDFAVCFAFKVCKCSRQAICWRVCCN